MNCHQARKQWTEGKPTDTHEARYAIFYTPPADHPLTQAAATWLGRDAFGVGGAKAVACSSILGPSIVSEPRRYGFHATLKSPFRLADGRSIEQLEQALTGFARASWPCPLGALQIEELRGYFALVPSFETPRFRVFASSIVEAFDRFRAPLNQAELRRRLADDLDDDEATHLVRWGYPYVFDCFRLHFTLTNRVEPNRKPEVRSQLLKHFETHLAEDYSIDALTLFEQSHVDANFVVRSRFVIGRGQVA